MLIMNYTRSQYNKLLWKYLIFGKNDYEKSSSILLVLDYPPIYFILFILSLRSKSNL